MKQFRLCLRLIFSIILGWVCGYVYWHALVLLGAMCGGAGHGTTIFFDAALFPNGYGIFFWEFIGILLGYIKYRAQAVCAGLLMACHYGYLIWQSVAGAYPADDFAKAWQYIAPVIALTALVYLAGQALIWRRITEGLSVARDQVPTVPS